MILCKFFKATQERYAHDSLNNFPVFRNACYVNLASLSTFDKRSCHKCLNLNKLKFDDRHSRFFGS